MGRRVWGFRRLCDDRWFRWLFVLLGWRFEGQFRGVVRGEARRLFAGNRAGAGMVGRPCQITDQEGPHSKTRELIVQIHLKVRDTSRF